MIGSRFARLAHAGWPLWVVGLASLVWLLLRSGTNPRRLAYPCQRAALATSLSLLGTLIPLVGLAHLLRFARRRTAVGPAWVVALGLGLALVAAGGGLPPQRAAAATSVTLPAWTSPTAVSAVFAVTDVPVPTCSLDGGVLPANCSTPAVAFRDLGVEALVAEMERRGEHFYATAAHPDGVVGVDDVVVLKVNNQWGSRYSTNGDVVKGVIWAVVQHPDGFTGEVVVADNTQTWGPGFGADGNAEDTNQSLQDVVDAFAGQGYSVSTATWDFFYGSVVSGGSVGGGIPPQEFVNGNNDDLFILLDDPATAATNELAYPKFTTTLGTRVSMRYGVYDPLAGTYDSDRLTFVNLPVLKKHGMAASTIAWKNLVGFTTTAAEGDRFGDWNAMHGYFWGYDGLGVTSYGLLGREMALIRAPDLNLVDAIWVSIDDNTGGDVVRQDIILASRDPFAVDWYASEHLLRLLVSWGDQDSSAARAGIFRNATRVNQNAAAAVWPGTYPWIDLLNGVNPSTPAQAEIDQMNVYVTTAAVLFADGFESGSTGGWTSASP